MAIARLAAARPRPVQAASPRVLLRPGRSATEVPFRMVSVRPVAADAANRPHTAPFTSFAVPGSIRAALGDGATTAAMGAGLSAQSSSAQGVQASAGGRAVTFQSAVAQ